MITAEAAGGQRTRANPRAYVLLTIAILTPLAVVLLLHTVSHMRAFRSNLGELAVWTGGLAILNLLPVPMKDGLALAPDIPVGIAVCMIFDPISAALIGWIASFDRREFTEPHFLIRSLYNRSNQSLGLLFAGWTVHRLFGYPQTLSKLALASIVAYCAWSAENYLLIAIGRLLYNGVSFVATFRQLHVGKPVDYMLSLLAWCMTGALLVRLYELVGLWTMPAFLLVAVVIRQMLIRSDSVIQSETELAEQRSLIRALSQRMATERRDERARLASYLHDEVVQSLFQASLLCQVLRLDIAAGRLLDLEQDIPAAQNAVDAAGGTLRRVIKDLRSSAIGPRGLSSSLKALIDDTQGSTAILIHNDVTELSDLDPELQLIVYQVGREALTNAIHHAKATEVTVSLHAEHGILELSVQDDGVGFDAARVKEDHFGLLLMEERTASVDGLIFIDSEPGRGTSVRAQFPLA